MSIDRAADQQEVLTKPQSCLAQALEILSENKELVIGPAITLIPPLFSLPLFIVSLSLNCQNLENNQLRYLLIASYLTSFIPQVISFLLYVSPSSLYSKEWQATTIGRGIFSIKQNRVSFPFQQRKKPSIGRNCLDLNLIFIWANKKSAFILEQFLFQIRRFNSDTIIFKHTYLDKWSTWQSIISRQSCTNTWTYNWLSVIRIVHLLEHFLFKRALHIKQCLWINL